MKFSTSIPPTGWVLLAIVAIQVGAALATQLFPIFGANGAVAIRLANSAVVLVFLRSRLLPLSGYFAPIVRYYIQTPR